MHAHFSEPTHKRKQTKTSESQMLVFINSSKDTFNLRYTLNENETFV